MEWRAAVREIKEGKHRPVYVLYGAETYFIGEFIRLLTDKLVQPDVRDFAVSRYDLGETSIESVLEDAQTPPFMVPLKLIVASNATFLTGAKDKSKAEHRPEALGEYAYDPMETTVLVVTVEADKLDERKKLVKLLKEQTAVLQFTPLSAQDTLRWIADQAKQRGCAMDEDAARALANQAGADLKTLSGELDKLSLYAGNGGTIRVEMVEEMAVHTTEQNVFKLVEEVAALRMDRAFGILHDLLKQREEPVKITALLARQFRMILQVQELARQGYSQSQIAGQIGAHPYAVKIAGDQSRRFQPAKLAAILEQLAQLDYEMKSGRVEKVLGLELFLMRAAGE